MAEFDYKTAWTELAKPQFVALSRPVKDIFRQVAREAKDLPQNHDCSMSFPKDSDLRAKMEALDNEELAHAARVIYFFGHWSPAKAKVSRIGNGATWRFALLADRVLRDRHNVTVDSCGKTGILIIEGYVRVFYQTRDCWTWKEVGPATDAIVQCTRLLVNDTSRNSESDDWLKSVVDRIRPLCDNNARLWLTTNKYMK